jgi:enoyl-CoA hydratase/carnithine racemase
MRNQTITAEQAVAWGLASRIVPANRIREEALNVAAELAAMKVGSIGHTKATLGPACSDLEARLEAERTCFVQQITTEEARQGIEAFLQQRQAPTRDDRQGQ